MMSQLLLDRQLVQRQARAVESSARSKEDILRFFHDLIARAEAGHFPIDVAASGLAYLAPNDLVLYDDLLSDIATLAVEVDVPARNPTQQAERQHAFDLIRHLIARA